MSAGLIGERLGQAWLNRLAVRAQAGDKEAFRRLYRALYPVVSGYIGRRVRVAADAEDLTAKVFHRALERLSQFCPDKGSVSAWVLTIARNVVIDHHRMQRPTVAVDVVVERLADGRSDLVASLMQDESQRIARELLSELDTTTHELLALRFGDGLSHRAIGQILNMSEVAVKQRVSRSLRELRELFARRQRAQGEARYVV